MRATQILMTICIVTCTASHAQTTFCHDEQLRKQIISSGFLHSPLPVDTLDSHEAHGWKKTVISETGPLPGLPLEMSFSKRPGQRAVGSPGDPDYATYGGCQTTYDIGGKNLEEYNRIEFWIYPECKGMSIVNVNLSFITGDTPDKPGFNRPSGSHLVNLRPGTWNKCFLEIDEYQRDNVLGLTFSSTDRGSDIGADDYSAKFIIDRISFQKVSSPDKVSGWEPSDGAIIYSSTGYTTAGSKTAITNAKSRRRFSIIDTVTGKKVFSGQIRTTATTVGQFGILDFSSLSTPGTYKIQTGHSESDHFRISDNLWDDSAWRVLNFIFCQRCGHDVPGIHGICHKDLYAIHDGHKITYSGGWHDAGDLSQQTLQSGDVTYSLLEAYSSMSESNPILAARMLEEARWGLSFLTGCRFGDGYRASSMGLLIWQDGITGTFDDINSVRVQNNAFDNFLFAGYEAFASMTLPDIDKELKSRLRDIAEEDFRFASEKFAKDGYDIFAQPYEHTYNTSHCLFQATISWAASQLYRLTGKEEYANAASDAINYVLSCQCTDSIGECPGGFFYRDDSGRSIIHYIHQSRDQIVIQALALLCQTQKESPDHAKWMDAIRLYGNYLKHIVKYTSPYGMIPSGVYKSDEWKDSESFYALHLFPPKDAEERYSLQIGNGVRLDNNHYLKRFPVWFGIFNGNSAVHLSTGKAAAICGRILGDNELLQIAREQLYWTVGKNPFGQSLIYGEGHNYPQMNSFSSGEITGEMPVGIRTLGDDDIPYWPQTNNACYKEVWLTTAGKWISLLSEFSTQ